jgi:hypothetical protein
VWPWINEHLQPVVRPVNFQTKHNPQGAVLCVVRCSTRTQCLCTARNAAVRGHAVMHCRQWSRGEPRRIRAVQRCSHLVDSEAGLEPKPQKRMHIRLQTKQGRTETSRDRLFLIRQSRVLRMLLPLHVPGDVQSFLSVTAAARRALGSTYLGTSCGARPNGHADPRWRAPKRTRRPTTMPRMLHILWLIPSTFCPLDV